MKDHNRIIQSQNGKLSISEAAEEAEMTEKEFEELLKFHHIVQ